MTSSRSNLRSLALLLALTGVLFRGLIPAGFMPAIGADARGGAMLVLCSGGLLKPAPDADGHPAAQAMDDCPFAAAASPALPPVSPQLPPSPIGASARVDGSFPAPPLADRDLTPPTRGPPFLS